MSTDETTTAPCEGCQDHGRITVTVENMNGYEYQDEVTCPLNCPPAHAVAVADAVESYHEQLREWREVEAEHARLVDEYERGEITDREYDEHSFDAMADARESLAESAVALLDLLGYGLPETANGEQ